MIDKWREPHGSEAGSIGIKSDHLEDVREKMRDLGATEAHELQSLDRLTTGDLQRLSDFLDHVVRKG